MSDDGGVNWECIGRLDNGIGMNQIAIDPQSGEKPERIYMATDKGLYGIGPFLPGPWIELPGLWIEAIEPKNTEYLSGTVAIKAKVFSTVKLKQVEFFVDDKKIGEANPSGNTENIYTCDWDTRQYGVDTEHTVKVNAVNEQGYARKSETRYKVQNVWLWANAEAFFERSWLMRKWFMRLTVKLENPYQASIDRYILYKNTSGSDEPSDWEVMKTYNAMEMGKGTFVWYEPCAAGKRYWYRVEARDAKNTLLAVVESNSQF